MPERSTPSAMMARTLVVAATVLGAAALAPAAEAATTTTACAVQPTTKAFAKVGDSADYSVAPGGTFESGTPGWTLTGGAKVVSGNESLGVAGGSRSLQMPPGSTATSPAFCVDETKPHFRFVTKAGSAMSGYLAVVLYRDAAGKLTQAKFDSSSDMKSWAPGKWLASQQSPLATNIPLTLFAGKTASVQIMIMSLDVTGGWGKFTFGFTGMLSVDSVMVDPYRRG